MTQMAEVTLPVGANVKAFNNFAGNQDKIFYYDEATRLFEIPGGNQGQLNGKLTAYNAGQTAIDQQFTDFERGRRNTGKKNEFDSNDILIAVVKWATDEINTLRVAGGLAALTGPQVRTAIRNKIDNP